MASRSSPIAYRYMYMLVVANVFIGKALTSDLLNAWVGLDKVAQALGFRDNVSVNELVRRALAADSEQTGVPA